MLSLWFSGAQATGRMQDLCADVPAAKALFDQASEILGYDLLKVCAEGGCFHWIWLCFRDYGRITIRPPVWHRCQQRQCITWEGMRWWATGPKEKLDSTAVSQPAIYVASLAAIEKLRAESGDVSAANCAVVRAECFALLRTLILSSQECTIDTAGTSAKVGSGMCRICWTRRTLLPA